MKNKGTALILVLAAAIIISIGTVAILQAMISYAQLRISSCERIKAQYLTEAGMQYAIAQCRKGDFTSPVNVTTEGWPIKITKQEQPDGSYRITVTVQYPGL